MGTTAHTNGNRVVTIAALTGAVINDPGINYSEPGEVPATSLWGSILVLIVLLTVGMSAAGPALRPGRQTLQ